MKKGFTLAEVLITLGIIGVVAAMTIPTLMANNTQKGWDTADSSFQRKLGEALSIMNTQHTLAGWNNTQDFVNELSKHMKIIKTCATPTDCFVKEAYIDDETIDMTTVTESFYLNKLGNYGTNVLGVIFANGINGLVAYNPKCTSDPFSNESIKLSGSINKKNSNVSLNTDCLSILYDINGFSKPNKLTSNPPKADLRGINVNLFDKKCVLHNRWCIIDFGTNYNPINCSTSAKNSPDPNIKSDYEKYCGTESADIRGDFEGIPIDYWAGGRKMCDSVGMRMPNISELKNGIRSWPDYQGNGIYWAESQVSYWIRWGVYAPVDARHMNFATGSEHSHASKSSPLNLMCVK